MNKIYSKENYFKIQISQYPYILLYRLQYVIYATIIECSCPYNPPNLLESHSYLKLQPKSISTYVKVNVQVCRSHMYINTCSSPPESPTGLMWFFTRDSRFSEVSLANSSHTNTGTSSPLWLASYREWASRNISSLMASIHWRSTLVSEFKRLTGQLFLSTSVERLWHSENWKDGEIML